MRKKSVKKKNGKVQDFDELDSVDQMNNSKQSGGEQTPHKKTGESTFIQQTNKSRRNTQRAGAKSAKFGFTSSASMKQDIHTELMNEIDYLTQTPPSLPNALKHKAASGVGLSIAESTQDLCLCCGSDAVRTVKQQQSTEPVPLKCWLRASSKIEGASATVNMFLRLSGLVLALSLFIALPAALIAVLNAVLKEEGVERTLFSAVTSADLLQAYFPANVVLHYLVAAIAFLVYHKLRNRAVYGMRKGGKIKVSHFSVALKNLPEGYTEKEITEMFSKTFGEDVNVADIQATYNIGSYMTYFRKLASLRKQKRQIQDYRHGRKSCKLRFCKSAQGIKNLKSKVFKEEEDVLKELGAKVDTKVQDLSKTDMAFVSLESLENKHFVINQTSRRCCFQFRQAMIRDKVIRITHAADPTDVHWENLAIEQEIQKCRRIVIWFVSALMVGACLGINYGIRSWQQQLSATSQQIVLLLSLGSIFITNVVIKKILFTVLSNWAKFYTQTKYEKYHSCRVLSLVALNTTLVPFIVYIQPKEYFPVGGLANQIALAVLLVSFGTAFAHFVDPLFIFKKIRQCLLRISLKKSSSSTANQWEANLLFEGPTPVLTDIYPAVVLPLIVSAFYLPLFPLGGVLMALGLFLSHLVFQVLLLRRWRKAPDHTEELAIFYMNLLLWIPLLYSAATCYFAIMTHFVLQTPKSTATPIVAVLGFLLLLLLYFSKFCCRLGCMQRRSGYRRLASFFTRQYETELSPGELEALRSQRVPKSSSKYKDANPVFRNDKCLLQGLVDYGAEIILQEDPSSKIAFDAASVFADIRKNAKQKEKKQIWKV